jgi:hypothetical protein
MIVSSYFKTLFSRLHRFAATRRQRREKIKVVPLEYGAER